LLYGSTGRPDLMGADRAAELAHAQYASAHRLAAGLAPDTEIYPTHGFGSFCSATQSAAVSSTIGREQTPLTLLGQTPEQVAEAQRELLRVGIDSPAAMAVGDPADWSGGHPLRSFAAADFSDLEAVRQYRSPVIVDVRRDQEWVESHVDGAIHMPLHELRARLPELPDEELWVYCRTGYRASVAASMLDAAGRRVVAVDDDYDRAPTAGLPIACA